MSRIGRLPITVPKGVDVNINGTTITVKGPKGELQRNIDADMLLKLDEGVLSVERPDDERKHRAMHGLTRSLLANMVKGVSEGFEKNLEIVGVGYRAEMKGEQLVLRVGYSHVVEINPMAGIKFAVEGNNRVKVMGINREDVGQMAAEIRKVRPPEPYKGKGIRYQGEVVRRKPGKAGKAGK